MREARVWHGPDGHPLVRDAIERAGGTLVPLERANTIVWQGWPPSRMRRLLHDGIEWVQLDSTGVDRWLEEGLLDPGRRWTMAHQVYAPDVAEHAVAFVLAAARRFPQAARCSRWEALEGERLEGRTIGFVGGGSITRETLERLRPFGVRTAVLTRSGRQVPGADRSLGPDGLDELLRASEYLVLAVPLTPETRGMIGAREFGLLGPSGWLVNVARGPLVVTEDLVVALAEGAIAGACLDVTDPEPLPDGHPLWGFPNVLVTPHVANPPGTTHEPLARLVEENVRRFREGRELAGLVDPERGY